MIGYYLQTFRGRGVGLAEEDATYFVTDEAEMFETGVDLPVNDVFCIKMRHVLAAISLISTQIGF